MHLRLEALLQNNKSKTPDKPEDGYTRTMTTAIALETSKGDLNLAMGLGAVLIAIVTTVNALAWLARRAGEKLAG